MYLNASSVGYAVPRKDFNAAVHSVFKSAVNVRLENDNNLLTIVANSLIDLPQGIRLSVQETLTFDEIRAGEMISCQEGVIDFENSSLRIDIHDAKNWECDLPGLRVDITEPASEIAWRNTWKLFDQRRRGSGLMFLTADLIPSNEIARLETLRKVDSAIRDLLDSTRRYNLADTHAIRTLIGLGAGLTPSCDDFLVGYLAGLWCTLRGKPEREQFIATLGKGVFELSMLTNNVSRTYLYHATHGQVSSLLVALVESICRQEYSENLVENAQAAMDVGHSSGLATVFGLLVGLAAWEGEHLLRYSIGSELNFLLA